MSFIDLIIIGLGYSQT